jgi:coenzyme F420-dependent glucose-6-phosphate dehydrogenase
MLKLGYALSSEEFGPDELVRQAVAAETAGFNFAMISDHFHPWTRRQGNSPFVWCVLGAIAQATDRIRIGTGVTCPSVRIHPAIIAQAAATAAMMLHGRFILGLGAGENLNEHIVGRKWPNGDTRLEMLEEAIYVINALWKGNLTNHQGKHFTVENAQIFSLPEEPPPIFVAASKTRVAQLAARRAQGMIATAPNKSLVDTFLGAGGKGKPRLGQMVVCWAKTEAEGQRRARELWPNALVSSEAAAELPLPRHFEQVTEDMSEEMMSSVGGVACGPDAGKYIDGIRKYSEAGFDHVYIHQVGPEQNEFIKFVRSEILPELLTSP